MGYCIVARLLATTNLSQQWRSAHTSIFQIFFRAKLLQSTKRQIEEPSRKLIELLKIYPANQPSLLEIARIFQISKLRTLKVRHLR